MENDTIETLKQQFMSIIDKNIYGSRMIATRPITIDLYLVYSHVKPFETPIQVPTIKWLKCSDEFDQSFKQKQASHQDKIKCILTTSNFSQLENLCLSNVNMFNIEFLGFIQANNLDSLRLENNGLVSLKPLEKLNLVRFFEFYIQKNPIKSIKPFTRLFNPPKELDMQCHLQVKNFKFEDKQYIFKIPLMKAEHILINYSRHQLKSGLNTKLNDLKEFAPEGVILID